MAIVNIYKSLVRKVGFMILAGLLGTCMVFDAHANQNTDSKSRILVQHLSEEVAQNSTGNDERLVTMDLVEVPLAEALQILAEEAGVGLSFSPDIIPDKTVTVRMEGVPVHRILYKMLEGTNLEPVLPPSRDVLVIREKERTVLPSRLMQFQEEVTGQVTDANTGSSLPGVNVVVQGTNMGTVTDVDGNFSLTVPSLNETLIVSYIGYQTAEVDLAGRSTLDVELSSVVLTGQEMVVTAFGIAREERSLSYSTQGVNTESIRTVREPNMMVSLQGKVAGLSITESSGGVGADARVVLRGNRSISGDSQPLYVVDGVPIRGTPTNLNSDNISSIDVLKGPNAAALYGSAAQNGAIVISTHRGEANQVSVRMNNNFMVTDPVIVQEFQNEYGQGSNGIYNNRSEFSWGPRMEGQMVDHWSLDPADAGTQYAMTPQPDNIRDFYQRGYNLSNNIHVNLGGDQTQAVFSFTRTDARGILANNELERNNVSVRINSQISDRLSLDSKLEYMRQERPGEMFQGGGFFNANLNIYSIPRNIRTEHMKNFEYTSAAGENKQNYWLPNSTWIKNPYWVRERILTTNTQERTIALTSLTYDFTDALSLMVRGGYDGSNTNSDQRIWNDTYNQAPDGRYIINKSDGLEWNTDFLLSYAEDVTEDWSLDLNIGGNIKQQRNSALTSSTGPSMVVPNFFSLSNTNQLESTFNPGSPMDVYSLYSFGQVGWRDAIYLDLSGRNDWSSTLPADNRSYFYPSAGLSVVLSDLIPDFPELFTFARARFTWSRVGSSAPAFMLNRYAEFDTGGRNGFLTLDSVLPNSDLVPEETESIEAGLDLRFFDGRLGVDITAYKTNTRNQLFTVNLPVGSGASQYFSNGGDIENKGVELGISGTPVQTMAFNWDVNLNFSANRNKVLSISDERPRVTVGQIVIEEGEPWGNIYTRGFVRDNQGRVIVNPDGLPRVTDSESVQIANFNPDWLASINNSFSYRNLSFSFLIDHRQGGNMYSMTSSSHYGEGFAKQTLKGREGGLVFGDNLFGHETAVLDDGSPNNIEVTAEDYWTHVGGRITIIGESFVEDATNTRLREVNLGYTLPQSVTGQLPVSSVTVSLVGRNLFWIYRASDNIDADLRSGTGPGTTGVDHYLRPSQRSYGVNLSIDF